MLFFRWCFALILLAGGGVLQQATGQDVDLGGRAYIDYFYNFADPSPDTEGLHGFQYRRLYLTADYTVSENVSGRARIEAPEGETGVSGVKVKDLSLTWDYSGEHSATIGVTPPPAFGLTEDVWGYRSLEKTVLDLQDIVSSRDFGLRVDGPLLGDGTLRYAAMVANNTGTGFVETDEYKRVYAQVQARPSDRVLLVAGADYAAFPDDRESGTRLSALAGYTTDAVRVGLETYWYQLTRTSAEARTDTGASLFGIVQISSAWEIIGRVDRTWTSGIGPDRYDTLLVTGMAYRLHPNVAFIPNLRLEDRDDGPANTTGRMTIEVDF
jgi:hypothetical protein